MEEREDGLVIEGSAGAPLAGGGPIATHLDHRIAMACAVAALVADGPTTVSGWDAVDTSYPAFGRDLDRLRQ